METKKLSMTDIAMDMNELNIKIQLAAIALVYVSK